MVATSDFEGFLKTRDFFRDNKMHQIQWPYFRGVTGQLGGIRVLKRSKKEVSVERMIPSIVGKGINRPMSVDAATLAMKHQMNNLSLSTRSCAISKRPVSSTPKLSLTKYRSNSSKSNGTLSTGDEFSSVASNSSFSDFFGGSSKASNSSTETNSESDNSHGVGKRVAGETYPRFNINTHNATKLIYDREKGIDKKESCGFLRCVMSELDHKERAEEAARRKAKRNANNTFSREQARQIERENQILLQKLLRVEKKKKREKVMSVPRISSTRKAEMEKESRRIRKDNARLYMKIKFARPSDDLMRASELG